jgi:hypothetical protein
VCRGHVVDCRTVETLAAGCDLMYHWGSFAPGGSHARIVAQTPRRPTLVELSAVGKQGALPAGFDGEIRGQLHQQTAPGALTPSRLPTAAFLSPRSTPTSWLSTRT